MVVRNYLFIATVSGLLCKIHLHRHVLKHTCKYFVLTYSNIYKMSINFQFYSLLALFNIPLKLLSFFPFTDPFPFSLSFFFLSVLSSLIYIKNPPPPPSLSFFLSISVLLPLTYPSCIP